MKVLIVDLDSELQSTLVNYFKARGDTLSIARNRQHACEILLTSNEKFDFVLSDQNMPMMSGIDFLNLLQKTDSFSNKNQNLIDLDDTNKALYEKEILSLLSKVEPTSSNSNDYILQSKINLEKSAPLPDSEPDKTEELFRVEETTPRKIRILVVDDDLAFNQMLCYILTTQVYEVESSANGKDAFQKWQLAKNNSTPFDLLLVDLVMPEMDGPSFLKAIRITNSQVPVIVLTGKSELDDAFSLLDNYQISDFITKPLENAERLLFSVKNALEKNNLINKLTTANHELEWRVKKRTQELLVEKERAEFANHTKSNFLSHMSHELRTPMNAILGFGQILEMDSSELNNDQIETVEEILGAGHHLLALIDEILDLAKIESGKMEITMQEVPVREVIQESIALIQPFADERQQKVVDRITNSDLKVNADIVRFKQVLLNLLSNAIKYNSENGLITLDCEVISNNRAKISITDSGKGLSEEKMSRLFTPFERLENNNDIQGTGIGLVITKNLTELMGGRLGVQSQVGKGSTFWLELEISE